MITRLTRRDLSILRRYYAKQVLLGRWRYVPLLWAALRAKPASEERKCAHALWEADDEGVECCVFCGVAAETRAQ